MIKPIGNRVLIKIQKGKNETKSGIVLTTEVEIPVQGTVVESNIAGISKEDEVICAKYGPDFITVDGQEYALVHEANILAIINK